jgi:hypothetical protein
MTFYRGQHERLIQAAELTTGFRSKHPALGRAMLLTHRDRRAVSQAYVGAATPAGDVSLIHYDPDRDPHAPRVPLPGLYRKLGIASLTEVGREALHAQADHERKRIATLWRLADGLMAGPLDVVEASLLLNPKNLQLGMLIGGQEEGLDTGIGIYDRETGEVTTDPAWLQAGSTFQLKDYTVKSTRIY